MTHRLPLLVSGRGRLFILCILLLLAIGNGYAQTGCSCPAVASCSPCAGGLTNLVLDYTGGGIIVTVTATDGDGLLSASLLSSTITITKTPANTPFNGSVTVNVVGVGITGGNQVIVTSCAVPVQQGSVFGSFKIVSGASLGGPLCCAASDQDHTAPTFSTLCPANIQRFVTAGTCSATATWTPPVATDNCGSAVTLTSTHNPGATFPLGITTITYTAKDIYNNAATCSFNVEVIDNILPSITCPSGFDVYVVGSCRFIVPDYTSLANATDNCTTVTVTQSPAIGTVLTNVGTVQAITLTATDGSGNTKNCSFNITLKDNIAPVITCPSNFNVFSNASCQFVIPSYISLAITNDNCGATVTQSPAIGTVISGVGTTQLITLTAKDATGNTNTCSFTITVKDNTLPVIICPANFDVFMNTNCQFILPNYTGLGSATDNCDTNVTITQSPAIGTVISGASRVITLTATDDSNNIATCTFTITLKDNIAPVIANCPSNISITTNASSCNARATWTAPTATDKCALSSLTSTHNPGSLFPLGITTVTYKATDVAGNSATCSFTVEVKDNVNPIITNCPSDITVSAGTGCRAIVTWTAPTATDNCSIASLTSNRNSGSLFVSGTTLVTYTAIDGSGNRSTCGFNVIVRDLTAPVFSGCPSTITINSEADCKTTVAWTAPTAADDCSTATVTSTHRTGDEFDTGTTSVTYTARDAAGNISTCSFNVVVIDKVAPQITCVANLTVPAGNTCGTNVSWTTPLVTDCSTVTLTSVPAMGSFFAVGSTDVTYTAADASGNSSTCTFKVTVEDKTRPVFTNCITEIKAVTDQSCKAIVSWTVPTATDNCSTPSLIASHSPGSEFPMGTTQVTYTATDAVGNTSQCQFAIIVTDGNVPVITNCPGDQSLKANESGQVTATWTEPTTSVTCGTATLTSSRKPGELFAVGANEVTYTSTSNSGIRSTCTFFINVAYEELMYEVSKLITPNGDGINDLWELKNIELFKDNKVTVVDRWGGVIYTAHGYNNTSVSWNGTNTNGAMVPTGTYFYTISVKFRDTIVDKKGFIELVR